MIGGMMNETGRNGKKYLGKYLNEVKAARGNSGGDGKVPIGNGRNNQEIRNPAGCPQNTERTQKRRDEKERE